MKKLGAGLLAVAALWLAPLPASAQISLPDTEFQWVQSTERQDYYFNKANIHYGVDSKGFVDLNKLVVPTVRLYDGVKVEDVVSKRRWNGLSVDGYDSLAGAAEYITIDLQARTVHVDKHEDLDSQSGIIASETSAGDIDLSTLSDKDVEGKFYVAIIKYADEHGEELAERTPGVISEETRKVLAERYKANHLTGAELEEFLKNQQKQLEKLQHEAEKKDTAAREARKKADEETAKAEKAEAEAKAANEALEAFKAEMKK